MEGEFFNCYFRMEISLEQPKKLKVTAANGQPMTVYEERYFQMNFGVHQENFQFQVIEELANEIIIETEAFYQIEIILDF
jgi:hypothetical protein